MANEWWLGRTVDLDLQVEAPQLMAFPITSVADMDRVGSMLVYGGFRAMAGPYLDPRNDGRPPPSTWEGCKREFRLLVCSEDARYNELRLALGAFTTLTSSTLIVETIAQHFGPHVGLDAVRLQALVAAGVAALISIGRVAFCPQAPTP